MHLKVPGYLEEGEYTYSDKLPVEQQADWEEIISYIIFEFDYEDPECRPKEEECVEMAKEILLTVLAWFAPNGTNYEYRRK